TAPVISNTVGWESLSLLFAVGAVIAFLPLLLIDRLAPSNGSTSSPPSVGDLAAVLRDTTVWQLGSLYFASLSIFFILSSWMPSYLTTAFDVDIAESGLLLGIFTFVGIFGRSSGGVISDRIFGRRRRPVVLLSFSTTALLVAALAGLNVPTAVFIVLVVSGFAVQMSVGVLYAHVRDLVDRSVQGTAVSVFLLIGTCGSLTAPVVTGFLIEVTPGFMAAFGYAIALAVLAVILAWLAPEA
ncbi:MAG: nitrate/nitrite transporter, partial [Salinirussus sp.]